MKKILFLLSVLVITLSMKCKKECKTDCKNGGTCIEGNCECPTGYSGADCSTYTGGGGSSDTIYLSINGVKFSKGTILNITSSSADVISDFSAVSGVTISDYGHCWSKTNTTPTTADSHTSKGSTTSPISFTSQMTGLIPETHYYVSTYFIANGQTYYHDKVVAFFTLSPNAPILSFGEINNITINSATITNASIDDIGTYPITHYGHCWATTSNPTTANSKTDFGATNATITYSSNLTGLAQNTTYYVRTYATNNQGQTYYGSQAISFETFSPSAPTLTTGNAINITINSASITGASIDDIGTYPITNYGHCWATTSNPTTANSKTDFGATNATITYSSNLTGLAQNTTYYVRTYATNNQGQTYYGSQAISFETLSPSAPTLTTGNAINITINSASITGASIDDIGTYPITNYGHCWAITSNPTIANTKTDFGATNTTINFNSNISNLQEYTTYYVRAYATNTQGVTAYGNEQVFTTESSIAVRNGLLCYYTFENATTIDILNNFNAFNSGAISSTSTPNGENFSYFFESNDFMEISPNPLRNMTNASFNLWVKTTSGGGLCVIMYSSQASNYSDGFGISLANSKVQYGNSLGPREFISNVNTLFDGQWHMFTLTLKQNEQILYIDGIMQGYQTNTTGIFLNTSNRGLAFGRWGSNYFNGSLDNIRLYNRVLSQSEITTIYNARQ